MRDTLQALNKIDLDLTGQIRLKSTGCIWWRPAVILAHSGDSWLWAIGLGLAWLLTFSGSPDWHRRIAILEISVVIQALFVFGLKGTIKRERPGGEWGGIYRQIDPHSFPSGHATRAVQLALMAMFLGPAWFGWLLVVWAPLVCISRVMTGVHYISDVLVGALLGIILAFMLLAVMPVWIHWFPFLFQAK